jgi:diguanylate cyclase (GGDEF)-like protein
MLNSFSDNQRRQLGNAALLLLALFLVGAIWASVVRVREGMAGAQEASRKAGALTAQALDHELDIHVTNLLAMKYLSERFFAGRLRGVENPITRLSPVPDKNGYQSVLPESVGTLDTLGRITGLGPVPNLNDAVAEEMSMAIALTPLMRAVRERSPDVAWVQYASLRGFMFIFPSRGSEKFFFRPELFGREYFARATPQANPKRELFWSKPYEDAAGKGTIVTATQPVYQGDTFKGSVSIDVLASSLQRRIGASPVPNTHVRLVDGGGRVIVSTASEAGDADTAAHDVTRHALRSAPWTVELHVNRAALLLNSVRESAWHIATVLVLALSLVFVAALTRKSRQIRELAIRDGLTGLYNRRHFDEVAKQEIELARRHNLYLGLAILDIDFFKKYNDHYGHQQGDIALRAVALAARSAFRRATDQVFRVGGEEFAVLFSFKQLDELDPLMDKLNQAVRDLNLPHAGSPTGHLTVSIGATTISRDHWMDVDAAYKQADEGLYKAKNTGRDRTVVIHAESH